MKPKKDIPWAKLDNAAKIFPPTSSARDTKVFRFACELFEPIDKELLQSVLDRTVQLFPGYLSVMRHGMFWYYLESSALRPIVTEDALPVCSPLYDKNEISLLFRVSCYKNRINLEVYHVLADGTGAMEFLRALVSEYLRTAHPDDFSDVSPSLDYGASYTEKMSDSFNKYYDPKLKKSTHTKPAYKLKGVHLPENRIKIIEGILPAGKVLQLAHEHNTTVTVLLTSVLLHSIGAGMSLKNKKRPAVISIPVNLRKYFASDTARNFFGIIAIPYDFSSEPDELEKIMPTIASRLKEQLTPEKLAQHMNSLSSLEHNFAARLTPLFIKDFSMLIAYKLAARGETAAISNLGKIKLPEEYEKYIRLFDVMASTDKLQLCMCSFSDNMVISFSDTFVSTDIQKNFFRTLSKMGVPVEIVTNMTDEAAL